MAAIVLGNLAGATVTYNGVQFGGADSDYDSVPPIYSFRGMFVPDDSGRTIKGVEYTLQVSTIFYESTEAALATNVLAVKQKLSAPGKQLKIEGLGTAFGTIVNDIAFGPMPLDFNWRPLGQVAWECVWTIKFMVTHCNVNPSSTVQYMAFNFNTTWQNDFEGLCTRTISGSVEIPNYRGADGRTPLHIADEARDSLNVLCPEGFRRTTNVWRDNDAHNRLDFVVSDEALPGDVPPPDMSRASGNFSFDSEGPGFAQANATFSMNLTVAPNKPKSKAISTFLTAALSKYNDMLSLNPNGSIIPMSLSMNIGKYDQARQFTGSMTFAMTKCLGEMLAATKMWEPLTPNDYGLWHTSMESLWGNRGFNQLRGLASEAVVVDLCTGVTGITIGATGSSQSPTPEEPKFPFSCPDVPADGGWLGYDLELRVLREDHQSQHRLSAAYLPTPGSVVTAALDIANVSLGGPAYSQSATEQHITEHHGYPTFLVLLRFKGLRFKHIPPFPELKTVGILPVTLVKEQVEPAAIAFDVMTCPAWKTRGWRLYRVDGYIASTKAVKSKTSCAANEEQDVASGLDA